MRSERVKLISSEVTPLEQIRLKAAAKRAKMSLSAYVRMVLRERLGLETAKQEGAA